MQAVSPEKQPSLLARVDDSRKIANGRLELESKSAFGQYMTKATVASFMAALFPPSSSRKIKLLDPGAGVGTLTSAFFEHQYNSKNGGHFEVDAYEIDPVMRSYLAENLAFCQSSAKINDGTMTWRIISEDFISKVSRKVSSLDSLFPEKMDKYTHCIMNPPYRKISSASHHRACLRAVGIETVNLYSAFVALSLLSLEENGYLVAIIPRSFCNGLYYRPFRRFIFEHAAIKRLHLFASRDKAFDDDEVLQENIIVSLEKGGRQEDVTVSTSTDDTFSDISIVNHPFRQIVKTNDKEFFIHIPTSSARAFLEKGKTFNYTLSQIGIQVSTGPVVDFRQKDQLRKMPEEATVPLLYPCHFKDQSISWPIADGKKANAILANHSTDKWLYPNGFYTVVRRFSSKEEKRRIRANVIDPAVFGKVEKIGIENHLNVFHRNKGPLTEFLAKGLAVFLNSTLVDTKFRQFSGNTQVNVTDLKTMRYPSIETLVELGKWADKLTEVTQTMIDEKLASAC